MRLRTENLPQLAPTHSARARKGPRTRTHAPWRSRSALPVRVRVPRAAAVAAARPSAGRARPRDASRALSARLTSSAAGRARLLVLTRRLGWRRLWRRHALVERRRRGRLRVRRARRGRPRRWLLRRRGRRRRRRWRQRREGEGRGQGPHRAHGSGRRRPRHQQPRPRAGSRRRPWLEAPFRSGKWGKAGGAQLTQRRGVRSGRHGAPGDRHRQLLSGGGGSCFSFANLLGEGTRLRCRGARGLRSSRSGRRRAAARDAQRGRREGAAGAGRGRPGLILDWAGPR